MKLNLLILLIFLSISSCSRKPDETGFEFITDMIYSPALEAYSSNSLMADGKTMQLPPEHTIARNKMPFPFLKNEDEAIRAGEVLSNPYPVTDSSLARGKHLYKNFCVVCHDAKGSGEGPIIPKFPNPPNLKSRRLKKYPQGRIFHIITLGSGDMPAHSGQITIKDRWYLSQYIKQLQGKLER